MNFKKPILFLSLFTAGIFSLSYMQAQSGLIIRGERIPQLDSLQRNTISAIDAAMASGQLVFNTHNDCLEYWNGSRWVSLCEEEKWFYMPSFNLPLTQTSFNLYDEYKRQFSGTGTAGQFHSSGTSTQVATPYLPEQLEFFVTSYSSDVITVTGIDANGVLHYAVNSTIVPDGSFINVIYRVKQ